MNSSSKRSILKTLAVAAVLALSAGAASAAGSWPGRDAFWAS